MLNYLFLIIIGFILLIKGADFLVDGASRNCEKIQNSRYNNWANYCINRNFYARIICKYYI